MLAIVVHRIYNWLGLLIPFFSLASFKASSCNIRPVLRRRISGHFKLDFSKSCFWMCCILQQDLTFKFKKAIKYSSNLLYTLLGVIGTQQINNRKQDYLCIAPLTDNYFYYLASLVTIYGIYDFILFMRGML